MVHQVVHAFGKAVVIDMPLPALFLALIGAAALAKFAVTFIMFFAETYCFSGMSVKSFGVKQGSWAVVTGSTSGIGEAFAKQLARAGYNICLIGRNAQALQTMGEEIRAKFPTVKTQHFSVDFSRADAKAFDEYKQWLSQPNVKVGILVNNAGVSHNMPVPFAETDIEEMENILQVNIHSTLKMTRATLPHILAKNKETKSKALVLNIGSFAATAPSPLLATYSGSKAFLATWTKALAEEVKAQGVVVRLVLPGFVVSKMSKIRKPSAMAPTANNFVYQTLGSIGLNRGAQGRVHESTPFWTHALMDYTVSFIPESIVLWYNLRLHKDIRKRALRKAEREKLKAQ